MAPQRPSDTEQHLLLIVWRLGGDAYGLRIRDELREVAGRSLAVGAIYSTLVRMEKKGWVKSRLSDPTPVRGGKAKRFFDVTPEGVEALKESRAVMNRLWEDLEVPSPVRGDS